MKCGINKIWISCPISVRQHDLDKFKAYLEEHFPQVDTWDRNQNYNGRGLHLSDAVVFMLPDNKFEYNIESLPIGIKQELKRARDLKKKILIGYHKATTGKWAVYDSKFQSKPLYNGYSSRTKMQYYIKGIENSTEQVLMAAGDKSSILINGQRMASIKTVYKAGSFDRRLLLSL